MSVEPYPDDGVHPDLDREVSGIAMFNPVDPRPAYTEVLTRCPVARTPSGAVAVFDHETITEINRHNGISGAGGATAPLGTLGAERPLIPLDIDGPEHAMYRRVLDPMFAPKVVAELEPVVRARVIELLDGFADRGHAELYGELCDPLPSSVFVDLLGVPRRDLRTFVEFKNRVVRPKGDTLEEIIEYSRAAGKETYAYFEALLDEREASGADGDDVIGRLTRLRVEGPPLTRNEILDTTYLLIIAGLDTVAGSLSLLLAWLAQHPEERRWITADPARWPAAIEELMRFESPVMYGSRTALEDIEVGGRPYPRGTMFEVSWSAANLDPHQFPEPTTVDLARTPNRHIGFASGRHRCLGSNVARLELRVCMEELHRRIPDYAVAPGETIGYTAYGVRLADPLPVVW